ncbi:D-amino acid dehydrogenase [Novosphingobium resinovorum]|uniref:D-amino acid dehydrogenase n=1 Tax=Novosphingobium resinovorum TaxID=158500 RepID=A0A031JUH3_9SPHN|nr:MULTISPECIES: D-amino acid dehydrogenase [Novosphingobium]AOR79458.1 D-amino acid dehydrogenase [Novosphingobium resinovorum]EZP80605.1 D-amino acid dehydrogenase small subunit [Novosphingobium resinovorum]MBF7013626.1 D-amino acid dehydrogenase [Novosphingobium sp. HR1a]WJM25775.1 D-amino acid dehydrogenase [Novosphingobium resinovorum]
MARIIVIGAGITGVTAAYALLSRGHEVTLVERHRYPAMETSFANGGQLSASNAEVWNSMATITKGLRWLLRPDAPLLFNPRPSLHKYSWMAQFVGAIGRHHANTVETTRLAIAARRHLFDIAEREGIDFDLSRCGILHFYRNAETFEAARRGNVLLREGGLEREEVSPADIARIEPMLRGDFCGGFFTPSDSTGDIHKFTTGLARACARLGARFVLGGEVDGIALRPDGVSVRLQAAGGLGEGSDTGRLQDFSTDDLGAETVVEGDMVMVCAGVASRALAAKLGDRVNIYPVKGYSITVMLNDDESRAAAPEVSLLDEDAKIVTSRLGADRFRVAGTAEFNGFNRDIRADRIRPLVDWSERHFPGMSTRQVVPWAGLRPMTPTMMPFVGRGRHPRVFYNTGHGHLGWTLSAITAELVAQMIPPDEAEQRRSA